MSSSRTLSRKFRTSFTCIKLRFDPSIILLYIAASVEQYCDIKQVIALPENEGILERWYAIIKCILWHSISQPHKPCRLDPVLDESFDQGNATLYFGITRRSNQKGSKRYARCGCSKGGRRSKPSFTD